MRTTVLSFSTAVLMVAAGGGGDPEAAAQAPVVVRDRPITPGMYQLSLLAVREVEEELKLSDKQTREARAALKQYQDALATNSILSADARDQAAADRRWREVGDESEKAVAAILAPAQIKRFKELRLQRVGAAALADPKLATELKLTEEQQKEVKAVASDRQKKMDAVMRDSKWTLREMGVKVGELTEAADAAVRKVLTAEQKARWEEWLGERFHWPVS